MVSRITKEDTCRGARAQFVSSGGCQVRKAKTPKDPEMIVARRRTKKKLLWGEVATSTTRPAIHQMSSSSKSLHPKGKWHVGMKK